MVGQIAVRLREIASDPALIRRSAVGRQVLGYFSMQRARPGPAAIKGTQALYAFLGDIEDDNALGEGRRPGVVAGACIEGAPLEVF